MGQASKIVTAKVEDLEVRFAFLADHIRQLDEVVQSQANRIDQLVSEVGALRAQCAKLTEADAPMEEQVPPHY